MGTCRDEMKSSGTDAKKDDSKKDDNVFSKLIGRRKKEVAPEDAPKTFADMLEKADESLNKMLATKSQELKSESGREPYNRKALALLEISRFHLDSIIDACAEYSELK